MVNENIEQMIKNIFIKLKEDPNKLFYWLSILWISVIFTISSFNWLTHYQLDGLPMLPTSLGFSDATSWLPLANEVSKGNVKHLSI